MRSLDSGLAWLGSYLRYKHRLAYNRHVLLLTFFRSKLVRAVPISLHLTGWFTAEGIGRTAWGYVLWGVLPDISAVP